MRNSLVSAALILSGLLGSRAPVSSDVETKPVKVFTAAGTADILETIGKAFTAKTGIPVQVSRGVSLDLARQILQGAPADVFIPAGGGVLLRLLQAGMVDEQSSHAWVTNSLVVVAPKGSKAPPAAPEEIADPRFRRLSLANLEEFPAGVFARQSLRFFAIWETVKPRVVSARDAQAAMASVESGEADLAIVYATDARINPRVKVILELPDRSHEPIRHPIARVANSGASPATGLFMEFLRSAEARKILVEAGFTPAFP